MKSWFQPLTASGCWPAPWVSCSVPPLTFVSPWYVLCPPRTCVPAPVLVSVIALASPSPPIVPLNAVLPLAGLTVKVTGRAGSLLTTVPPPPAPSANEPIVAL